MSKKAKIILSSVIVVIIACVIVLLIFLSDLLSPPDPTYGTPENPTQGAISLPSVDNSLLTPELAIVNDLDPVNYFVRDKILSCSLVGQLPLNDINYTDIGPLYSVELTTDNFDNLFSPTAQWADGYTAASLREATVSALRADLTLGAMNTEIPVGVNYYLILTTNDSVYICHYSEGNINTVSKVTIQSQ